MQSHRRAVVLLFFRHRMSSALPTSVDELLQRMIQFDTVNAVSSGRERPEAELAAWLEGVAKAWGLSTRVLPLRFTDAKKQEIGDALRLAADQLLITVPADDSRGPASERPWLLFDSHLDTVSVQGMTIDPFGGVIEGDKMYGRGACDTKGTGAAMLWALKQYAASNDRPNNIALLFSTDEEFYMTGIASFIAFDLPSLGWRPRGVIVGEPTMLKAVVAHNGVTRWKITTTGVAAHSSVPFLGKSAIRMMNKVITAIEDEYIAKLDRPHDLTGGAVCTITLIQGGSQVNIVPDSCFIEIDRRLAPGETAETASAELQKVLDKVVASDEDMKVKLQIYREASALDPKVNEAFLPIVLNVLESHGLPKHIIGAPFATNAGDLAEAGLPVIVLGPGEPYPAHTKDEWVSLGSIRQGVSVYESLMRTGLSQ